MNKIQNIDNKKYDESTILIFFRKIYLTLFHFYLYGKKKSILKI
jgi:hypothetical protein